MIFGLTVDSPDIVTSAQDIPRSVDGSNHRVVLIVVLMHAIPANEKQVIILVEELTDYMKSIVCAEISRICLFHAYHGRIQHIRLSNNSDLRYLVNC